MDAKGLWVALLGATMLIGCGGGGSDPSAQEPQMAPESQMAQALQVSYPSPQTYEQGSAIAPLVPAVSGTATAFSVAPALPPGLTLDASSGSISGTPAEFAKDAEYTVTASGPGGVATAKLQLLVAPVVGVSRPAVVGTAVYPVMTLDASALGLSGALHARLSDSGGVFAAPVTVTQRGSQFQLELSTSSTLPVGVQSGRAIVTLCRDASCTALQPMPRLVVNYKLQILATAGAWPGDHLTALSPASGAPEWSTFQGNAAHNGHVPIQLDPNLFSTRWQIKVPAFRYLNGVFNLATVTTEGGRFFMAGNNAITARNEHDGSTIWTYSFDGLAHPSVNPPAVRDGVVYVSAGQQSSASLFALGASDGTVRFRSAMSNQWSNYLAPTVGPSGVYTNAGTFGGMYAFDLQGSNLYFSYAAQESTWTPAVDADAVYAYSGDALRVFHPTSGVLQKSIADPTYTNYIYEIGGSAVLGGANSVFAANYANASFSGGAIGNSLVHFNLGTNSIDWTVSGVYPSTPAYASGVVYAVNKNPLRLEARAETDGALIWSWTPQSTGDTEFVSEVLLTDNLAIVSTNQSTYAIDLSTHRAAWSYPAAGNLALSRNGVLYIAGGGVPGGTEMTLTAINLR